MRGTLDLDVLTAAADVYVTLERQQRHSIATVQDDAGHMSFPGSPRRDDSSLSSRAGGSDSGVETPHQAMDAVTSPCAPIQLHVLTVGRPLQVPSDNASSTDSANSVSSSEDHPPISVCIEQPDKSDDQVTTPESLPSQPPVPQSKKPAAADQSLFFRLWTYLEQADPGSFNKQSQIMLGSRHFIPSAIINLLVEAYLVYVLVTQPILWTAVNGMMVAFAVSTHAFLWCCMLKIDDTWYGPLVAELHMVIEFGTAVLTVALLPRTVVGAPAIELLQQSYDSIEWIVLYASFGVYVFVCVAPERIPVGILHAVSRQGDRGFRLCAGDALPSWSHRDGVCNRGDSLRWCSHRRGLDASGRVGVTPVLRVVFCVCA